jgi:hypothetical protein
MTKILLKCLGVVLVLMGCMLLMIGFGAFMEAMDWKPGYFATFYWVPLADERITPRKLEGVSTALMIISCGLALVGLILWRKNSRI